jgi:hypothetical protein
VVAELSIDASVFRLHDEGEGCVAVTIDHPGLQSTVHRICLAGEQVLTVTDSCGWLVDGPSSETGACDVMLPEALYGRVAEPEIGYVCIGQSDGSGGAESVTGARFVSFDGDGFILDPAAHGEMPYAHLYTREGIVYGEPPLDAPSGPIYELCAAQAPWGEPGLEYTILLRIMLAEELQTGDVLFLFDAGTGQMGVTGTASDTGMVAHPVRVAAGGPGLLLVLERAGTELFSQETPWPEEIAAILTSGTACAGLLIAAVEVTATGATAADAGSSC